MKLKNIAIDIDGVLTLETEGHDYARRTPNSRNIEAVRELFRQGHRITLFSARYPEDMNVTEAWLEAQVVPYHDIILGKLPYDTLVDDKACPDYLEQVHKEWVKNEQKALIKQQIKYIGEDPNREGLLETPKRIVKMWDEIYAGYKMDPADMFTVFSTDGYDQIVLLKNIKFYSMCEHHNLPFFGVAHIAYLPNEKVIGISKLARLLEVYTKRMQIQERIGEQVTQDIMTYLNARGAACIIEAEHLCMKMRGVKNPTSTMVTSSLKGVFLENAQTRTELFQLIKG